MKTPFFLLLTALLLLSADCAFADATLRPGDIVEMRVGGVPADEVTAVSGSFTLDGEGFINLTYLGKMQVGGMTSSQVQALVERAYIDRGIFTHPTISIASSARFVNVGGSVRSPSRVGYTPDMTVLTAINAAGDFTEFADQRKVRLMRGDKVMIVDCKKIRSNPSLDVKVLPGDAIQVPEGFW